MYDGRIVRELAGAELNETNIIASALNIEAGANAHGGAEATGAAHA
jgi:ribose transport system ATP-binding protein